jgi:hypothetical protein
MPIFIFIFRRMGGGEQMFGECRHNAKFRADQWQQSMVLVTAAEKKKHKSNNGIVLHDYSGTPFSGITYHQIDTRRHSRPAAVVRWHLQVSNG